MVLGLSLVVALVGVYTVHQSKKSKIIVKSTKIRIFASIEYRIYQSMNLLNEIDIEIRVYYDTRKIVVNLPSLFINLKGKRFRGGGGGGAWGLLF